MDGTAEVIRSEFATRQTQLEQATRPLLRLAAALAYWGSPSTDQRLADLVPELAPNPRRGGSTDLLNLLRAPGVLFFHCVGVASCAARRDETTGLFLGDRITVEDPRDGDTAAVASLHADLIYPEDASHDLHDYLGPFLQEAIGLSTRAFEQAWARWDYLRSVACECLRASGVRTYPPRPYLQIQEDWGRDPNVPRVTVSRSIRQEIDNQGNAHPLLMSMCSASAELFTTAAEAFESGYGSLASQTGTLCP